MKQHITAVLHFLTHDLWCRTCNPVVMRRRQGYANDAQAGGHMAYFAALVEQDKAAQDAKRQRLREMLIECGGTPWEVELLVGLVDARRQGKRVITQMPPQHPQVQINSPAHLAALADMTPDEEAAQWLATEQGG